MRFIFLIILLSISLDALAQGIYLGIQTSYLNIDNENQYNKEKIIIDGEEKNQTNSKYSPALFLVSEPLFLIENELGFIAGLKSYNSHNFTISNFTSDNKSIDVDLQSAYAYFGLTFYGITESKRFPLGIIYYYSDVIMEYDFSNNNYKQRFSNNGYAIYIEMNKPPGFGDLFINAFSFFNSNPLKFNELEKNNEVKYKEINYTDVVITAGINF